MSDHWVVKPTKIRSRLSQSLSDRRIVTAVRDDYAVAMTDGFVIAMAWDWVVMHSLNEGVYLDDIVMLRVEDISRAWFRDDDAYHHRAIAALGQDIASFDCDADVSASELLEAAAARADIFAVHFEVLREEPLAVGRLVEQRRKSFYMHYVGRDGGWAEDVERWKYRHVTRIEVGGRYLRALNTFADPYPTSEDF